MELREYISVRRAYNLVRQDVEASLRLTFEEFAVLCHLDHVDEPLKTSAIAEYQGALRPTMTHRTNRLHDLGLIEREEGKLDRRNIVCAISKDGRDCVKDLTQKTRKRIGVGQPLSRTTASRIGRYVDAMGAMYCTAGELVLLAMYDSEEPTCTVSDLVKRVGLLQPTVSMSVSTLVRNGLVMRGDGSEEQARSTKLSLTGQGKADAARIVNQIGAIVVRRKPRK